MEADQEKIKIIKILSIISLAGCLVGIIAYCINLIFLVSAANSGSTNIVLGAGMFTIFIILDLIAAGICQLIASILILATKFNSKRLEESKILWGLLSLLLLGPIASLVFCFLKDKN